MDESCQVPFIFHLKVGRIALAQQAYVPGDPRSQHRDSHAQGLAHHVGAAFHARADDHRVAGSEPGKRAAVRHAAEPAIARVALHRRERLSAERFVEGGAKVNDLNGAEMRQRGDDPNGSFSSRRWPITQTRNCLATGSWRSVVALLCTTTLTLRRSGAGSSAAAIGCSVISRWASASDSRASLEMRMSR